MSPDEIYDHLVKAGWNLPDKDQKDAVALKMDYYIRHAHDARAPIDDPDILLMKQWIKSGAKQSP
jgi:hypothetical protein